MRPMPVFFALSLAACGGATALNNSSDSIAAKDAQCATITDAKSCAADTADECQWLPIATEINCSGASCFRCVGPVQGGGTITADGGLSCPPAPSSVNCQKLTDEKSCVADAADHCQWNRPLCPTGPQCPPPSCGAAFVPGCGVDGGVVCVPPPQIAACQAHADQQSCNADSADQCGWRFGPCSPTSCNQGYCQSNVVNGCVTGSADGGVGHEACACPNGNVCMEQIGGPAMRNPPAIQCVAPAKGCVGDPCACITGQGNCRPDANVGGLCLCDNGIR